MDRPFPAYSATPHAMVAPSDQPIAFTASTPPFLSAWARWAALTTAATGTTVIQALENAIYARLDAKFVRLIQTAPHLALHVFQ